MATPLILDYLPRKQFEPFHERRERFACIVTHRRAGKTVACVQELQAQPAAQPGQLPLPLNPA